MSAINDLFNQIYASEQQAQKSKNLLSEARQQLKTLDQQVKEVQANLKVANRDLTQKQIRLAEQEVTIKCWEAKEESYKEQKETLTKELKDLKDKQSRLTYQLEKQQHNFCTKVQEFLSSYDLVATAQDHRHQKAKEELYKLQERELSLTRDMLAFNQRRSVVRQLTNEKTAIMDAIEWKKRLLAESEETYKKEEEILEHFKREKEQVSAIPQTDPQFLQLKRELEEGMQRNNEMEAMCAALDQELKGRQRLQWQKQSQKQLMQRRVQAQQKLHQNGSSLQQNVADPAPCGQSEGPNRIGFNSQNSQPQQAKWKFHKATSFPKPIQRPQVPNTKNPSITK